MEATTSSMKPARPREWFRFYLVSIQIAAATAGSASKFRASAARRIWKRRFLEGRPPVLEDRVRDLGIVIIYSNECRNRFCQNFKFEIITFRFQI